MTEKFGDWRHILEEARRLHVSGRCLKDASTVEEQIDRNGPSGDKKGLGLELSIDLWCNGADEAF